MAFTAKDILTLSRAGYNSAQIAEIARAAEMESADSVNTEQAAPAAPAAPAEAAPSVNNDILAKLTELTSAVQMGNMMRDQQPAKETPEDIIASIIRPPVMNSGGE